MALELLHKHKPAFWVSGAFHTRARGCYMHDDGEQTIFHSLPKVEKQEDSFEIIEVRCTTSCCVLRACLRS